MKVFKMISFLVLLIVCQIGYAQVKMLVFGEQIENSISKSERHTYQVKLASGGLFYATVEQIGVDIVIAVIDPNGK